MKATVQALLALVQQMAPPLNTALIEELCPGGSQPRTGQPYFNGWVGMYPGIQLMTMDPNTIVDVGDAKPLYRGYWVLFATDQSRVSSSVATTDEVWKKDRGWYPADATQDSLDAGIRAGWEKLGEQNTGKAA
jgi:hypothetical protein